MGEETGERFTAHALSMDYQGPPRKMAPTFCSTPTSSAALLEPKPAQRWGSRVTPQPSHPPLGVHSRGESTDP